MGLVSSILLHPSPFSKYPYSPGMGRIPAHGHRTRAGATQTIVPHQSNALMFKGVDANPSHGRTMPVPEFGCRKTLGLPSLAFRIRLCPGRAQVPLCASSASGINVNRMRSVGVHWYCAILRPGVSSRPPHTWTETIRFIRPIRPIGPIRPGVCSLAPMVPVANPTKGALDWGC
jgi:hypothetical protein